MKHFQNANVAVVILVRRMETAFVRRDGLEITVINALTTCGEKIAIKHAIVLQLLLVIEKLGHANAQLDSMVPT